MIDCVFRVFKREADRAEMAEILEKIMSIQHYPYTTQLDLTLAAQAVFTFCYFISSIVMLDNSYAGFNGALLGLLYGATIALSYKGLKKDQNRIIYGIILGAVFVLVFLSLQSAIFWGQYSGCESYSSSSTTTDDDKTKSDDKTTKLRRLTGVECYYTSAMSSMSAFSVFMFLSYIVQLYLMIKHKHDILGDPGSKGGYATIPPRAPNSSYRPVVSSASIPSSG